jgi:hypothetical protein
MRGRHERIKRTGNLLRIARHSNEQNLEYRRFFSGDIEGIGLSATIRTNKKQVWKELGSLYARLASMSSSALHNWTVSLANEPFSTVSAFEKRHVAFRQGFG